MWTEQKLKWDWQGMKIQENLITTTLDKRTNQLCKSAFFFLEKEKC